MFIIYAFVDIVKVQMADLLEAFLKEKGLDGRKNPHKGPVLKTLNEYTIPIANKLEK